MIKVKMFGSLRIKTGYKGGELEAKTVKEACEKLAEITGWPLKEFYSSNFVLNGKLVKASTELKDGDELVFMAASGGG